MPSPCRVCVFSNCVSVLNMYDVVRMVFVLLFRLLSFIYLFIFGGGGALWSKRMSRSRLPPEWKYVFRTLPSSFNVDTPYALVCVCVCVA